MKVGEISNTALDLAADLSTVAASRNPKAVVATAASVKNYIHRGEDLFRGKIQ